MPKAYPSNKAMDPDRFQMKDLKRRISAVETAHSRLLARYNRLILRIDRENKSRESILNEVQTLLNRQ